MLPKYLTHREAARIVKGDEKVDLFDDDVYKASNQFQISTSQVPIALPGSYMGYGAVIPDGYGVSYNLQANNIIFCVASFFHAHATDSRCVCVCITLICRPHNTDILIQGALPHD